MVELLNPEMQKSKTVPDDKLVNEGVSKKMECGDSNFSD